MHTLVWAFFVACVLSIWILALRGDVFSAAFAIGLVSVEVVVLAFNKGAMPAFTHRGALHGGRRANFDIYLPEWLAARTKPIFGALYVGGIAVTCVRAVLAAR